MNLKKDLRVMKEILDQYYSKDNANDINNPDHWIRLNNNKLGLSVEDLGSVGSLEDKGAIKIVGGMNGPLVIDADDGILYTEDGNVATNKDDLHLDILVTNIDILEEILKETARKIEKHNETIEIVERYLPEIKKKVGNFELLTDDTIKFNGELINIGRQLEMFLFVLLEHEGALTNYSDFDDLIQGKDKKPLPQEGKRRRISDLKKTFSEKYGYSLNIDNLPERGWVLKV